MQTCEFRKDRPFLSCMRIRGVKQLTVSQSDMLAKYLEQARPHVLSCSTSNSMCLVRVTAASVEIGKCVENAWTYSEDSVTGFLNTFPLSLFGSAQLNSTALSIFGGGSISRVHIGHCTSG